MKKKLILALAAATVLSSGITVCAALQYMEDGAIFDPEWYLEQNPDVAETWDLGTSPEAFYKHSNGAGGCRKQDLHKSFLPDR